MDILISSNLERLIYHITGDDPEKTSEYMERLRVRGAYGDHRRDAGKALRLYRRLYR